MLGPARVFAPLAAPRTALPILALAAFSTVLPFGAFLVALRTIDATRASVTAMLEPVAAGIGAAVFFGQPLTQNLIIGGLIIIGAITFIQLAERHAVQKFPREG